jgi:LCP family protein required for cell wall assembly
MQRASVPGGVGSGGPRYGTRPSQGGRGYDDWPPRGSGGGPGGPPPQYPSGGGGGGGSYGGGPYRGRRKPKWGRIALVAGAVVVVIALIAGFSLYNYSSNLNDDLARTNAFANLSQDRPDKKIDGALNILLVGSDSRDPDASKEDANSWRADTMILMHIPEDHKSAQLISIPRDLYVKIPKSAGDSCDTERANKINASFAFGGLPLAVKTVECLTDVRVDHVLAIDFGGFREVTDAIGGVDLYVEKSITSIHKPYRKFKKGTMHMDGSTALDWVRQRKQFARGDFDRVKHQQEYLKALMDKAVSKGVITEPAKLDAFLKATTKAITADNDFDLTDMAVEMRDIRGENLTFMTNPNKGSDTIGGQSVVVNDKEKSAELYQAIAEDKVGDFIAANPDLKR